MARGGYRMDTPSQRRIRDNWKIAGYIDINGYLGDQSGVFNGEVTMVLFLKKFFNLFKEVAVESENEVFERVRCFSVTFVAYKECVLKRKEMDVWVLRDIFQSQFFEQ
jgi:hypothetical protein